MIKFSWFKNNRSDQPSGTFELEQFIDLVKSGRWAREVLQLRKTNDEQQYKRFKSKLSAVTISGEFRTRNKYKTLDQKLKKHTGCICLDVDKKDNPRMRVKDLIDRDALAEFVSAGGEGKKIIYLCKAVTTAEEHRRIFDAAIERLTAKGITIKVDPIVKSIASLQYVTFDPQAYYNPKSKVVLQPLPPVERKRIAKGDVEQDRKQLEDYIKALGTRDVTSTYENWMLILFGISYTLGEQGRDLVHKICSNYRGYSKHEVNEKFDSFLDTPPGQISKPVTLNTVYHIINEALPKRTRKDLGKRYSTTHAVGVADDTEEQGDLRGLVRYKLFLFKKIVEKVRGDGGGTSSNISELVPHWINLNAFEQLLKQMGFFRYGEGYVQIKENIVETVDVLDILRIVTEHIEREGDYKFVYKGVEYEFKWEEIAHFWRENRAASSMYNQVTASLNHWQPNLLKDTATESYVPYSNGVVKVTSKSIELIPYKSLKEQIWKERILPRAFIYTKQRGMFEEFFANVMGRGGSLRSRIGSQEHQRSLWYFGYMLHGTKRQSTARAWLLYDTMSGNNGRTGKTIIGTAVGKIRSVTVIDGKNVDLKNRFAFQTVEPWTDVIFVDDPAKGTSIIPFFNMITGQTTADKKAIKPVVKDMKIMIASNWILESENTSESGRQFVSQLERFYVSAKSITPIVDVHGKEFFTDWDIADWSQFDCFAMRALQHYFKGNVPENVILGSSGILRFTQLYDEELFFILVQIMKGHVKDNKVAMKLLNMEVNDYSPQNKTRTGKIVRAFLAGIGCKNVRVTTTKVGAQTVNCYAWDGTLNYGKYA